MRTLEWRSLGGAEYRLEIQDGMDEVRGLVGGASPFVTSTDDDDDFFAAVRTTTGAICVLGDVAEVEELVTGVPADKLVELYAKKSDGTDLGCVWRGFLQTTAYSQAWDKGPLQFSLPVVSPLGVLDSFYPKADVVAETWSFAEFLVNANKAKEGMLFWDGFVFPASCNPEQTLMYRMQMQNFGTYDEKQERWHVESYMMILQEVCKLFGWACQEWNNKLVFLSADDTTEYLGYRADRLEQKVETGVAIVENIRVETTAETIWGKEHQLDYIDGKKSVEVTGEVNAFDNDSLWALDFEKLEIDDAYYNYKNTGYASAFSRYLTINFKNGSGITAKDAPGNFKFETWISEGVFYNGATIVKERYQSGTGGLGDNFLVKEYDSEWHSRLLWNAKGLADGKVLFTIETNAIWQSWMSEFFRIMLTGKITVADSATGNFEPMTGGSVMIKAYVGSTLIQEAHLKENLHTIRDGVISNWYVNELDIEGYNLGGPGFISGAIKLEIVAKEADDRYYSIEELGIAFACDWRHQKNGTENLNENKKGAEINNAFVGEYNVKCLLTTRKKAQAGYGIILANDVMAEPPASLNVSGERPEVHLAERLWNYYKQSRKKLTVQLKMDGEGLNPMNLHSFSEAVPLSTGNNSEAVPRSTGNNSETVPLSTGNNSEAVPQSTEIRGMACLAQTIDWAEDMVTAALFEV